MHKGFLRAGVLIAMVSVAMGAFGAHTLKGMIGDHAIATFETGVRYQFYHAFALIITGILYKDFKFKTTAWAGMFFIVGIIFFCGSLYFLTALQAMVSPNYKWVGAITPFGGLSFLGGWLLLFISFFKKN
ncbi:DUF423 domain-containing protein [soil metagenome]